MPLQKNNITLNFAQGLDTKTDPLQVEVGKFLSLSNTVFTKGGRLGKRNGFSALTALDGVYNSLTTFNGNLTAIGEGLSAYSQSSDTWVDKGNVLPVSLNTLPIIRNSTNQTQADSVLASNGLMCVVYTDNVPSGGSNVAVYKYAIINSVTGQNIIAPTVIPVSSGTVTNAPRVFLLANYFIIVFTNVITATTHLQYISISTTAPTLVSANVDISSQVTNTAALAWDGAVANGSLFLAWNGSDGGGAIRYAYLNSNLTLSAVSAVAGKLCTIMSVCADLTTVTPNVYFSYYDSVSKLGYTLVVDQSLNTVTASTLIVPSGDYVNITSSVQNGVCTVFLEKTVAYSYGGATNVIDKVTITQSGTVGTLSTITRSVGLGSKSFLLDGAIYVMSAYSSAYQPSYFLLDSSGKVICKLAYSNGGGYCTKGLPSVSVDGSDAYVAYLLKDLVQSTTKTDGSLNPSPIYSQTGVNIAKFSIGGTIVSTAEIGSNLMLSGGMLWGYDGYSPVENGFNVWPDTINVTTATGAGALIAQDYYYIATYEWADNQGNLYRSAPSIPIKQTTTTASSTNTIKVPTLRLTYKTLNPVKIVLYRWSTAQQTYHQVTSILIPTLNSLTVDEVTITDALADASIAGNNILYTTGGVVENIGPPATDTLTLYRSRLFLVDAEDRNLLWFSKQVVESTPVEMSDLFTIYVAPTTSAQGNTGPITALSALDDKLIIFKRNAIYYITGNGPDNTGANNDFSEPVFITSTVGCANEASIVFTPNGLMFQSDKGIWLLGRDLGTTYIGAPVEDYNSVEILSAINIPATNQIRFTLSSGITLMYDYFYGQWGTFNGIPAISSTLYQLKHTFINQYGKVFQEQEGVYLDGAKPVTMSFKTSWLNIAGLQGFERAYSFFLLGTYISPHKIQVEVSYDYNPSPTQTSLISPDNYAGVYGSDSLYGGSTPYGGPSKLEQWQVYFRQQKCQAFQITINEVYDPSFGVTAGAGLTLSGLDINIGMKSLSPKIKQKWSVG